MLAEIFGLDGIVVLIVVVAVLFGGTQIPKLARSLGSARSEFKKGLAEVREPGSGHGDRDAGAARGARPRPTASGGIVMILLSPPKLLMILVIALIVLGPDKLPSTARRVGAMWNDVKRWRAHLESEVRATFPDLPSTTEIARAVRSPLSDARPARRRARRAATAVTPPPRVPDRRVPDRVPDVVGARSCARSCDGRRGGARRLVDELTPAPIDHGHHPDPRPAPRPAPCGRAHVRGWAPRRAPTPGARHRRGPRRHLHRGLRRISADPALAASALLPGQPALQPLCDRASRRPGPADPRRRLRRGLPRLPRDPVAGVAVRHPGSAPEREALRGALRGSVGRALRSGGLAGGVQPPPCPSVPRERGRTVPATDLRPQQIRGARHRAHGGVRAHLRVSRWSS